MSKIFSDDASNPFWSAVWGREGENISDADSPKMDEDKRFDILYDYGCKAQTIEHQLETLRGETDWRSRTCGECGWLDLQNGIKHVSFPCNSAACTRQYVQRASPSCPAFVARKSATHAASIAAGKE